MATNCTLAKRGLTRNNGEPSARLDTPQPMHATLARQPDLRAIKSAVQTLRLAEHARAGYDVSAGRFTTDAPVRIDGLPTEDVVILHADSPWRVPWELLILGPFTRCALEDEGGFRLITTTAMVRSALRASSAPDAPLCPHDYDRLLTIAPDIALLDAARSMVAGGWEMAIVTCIEPRLITSQTVFRSLLHGGAPVYAAFTESRLRMADFVA